MPKAVFQLGDRLPTLNADPVRLRWLTDADVPALFAIFGDPLVTRYWGFAALPDLEAAAALLEDIHREFRAGSLSRYIDPSSIRRADLIEPVISYTHRHGRRLPRR
jgi:hypothetical protein